MFSSNIRNIIKRKGLRTALGLLLFFLYPKAQAQIPDLTWSSYDTSGKIDLVKFSKLTKQETDFAKYFEGFTNNRARLTLTDSGNRIYPQELQRPDFPVLCLCKLTNDTIHITTALGFMSGLGIITVINKEHFGTRFFQEADNTDVFKLKKSDTSYADRISVPAVRQKLTLLRRPSFVNNETIIGTVEAQFKPFYEFYLGSELTRNYRAKFVFKCRPRTTN